MVVSEGRREKKAWVDENSESHEASWRRPVDWYNEV